MGEKSHHGVVALGGHRGGIGASRNSDRGAEKAVAELDEEVYGERFADKASSM